MKAIVRLHRIYFSFLLIITGFYLKAQTVSILSPTGSEEQKFGETLDITWDNSDPVSSDRFYLYYSVDGQGFVSIISNQTLSTFTNSGSQSTYTWTIPDLLSDAESQVRIRILNNTQSLADTSESFRVYYEPSVMVSSPTGSEELKFGDPITITWDNGDHLTSDRIYLYYSVDGAGFISLLNNQPISTFTNVGDQSSYDWTIPDLLADSESQVRIRVLNNTRLVSDTSESFRVYHEPSVTITSPTGSEELKFGDPITITWDNGDHATSDRIYLYYSVDGAGFISFLNNQPISTFTSVGDQSSYDWTIPDLLADSESQVRIRVLNNTRLVSDTSESFRVYHEPSVTITSPTGSEELKFGDPITITWDNGDHATSDRIYLYYSVDGAGFISLLNNQPISTFTNIGDQSSYDWTIPDLLADSESQVRIRVLNNTRLVSDTSESFRVYNEPSVTIISPYPGEFVQSGSTKTITWDNGDHATSDRIYLYYSVDGGGFISFLNNQAISTFTNVGNQSSYGWVVPSVESTNVKLRVLNNTRLVSDTTLSFSICTSCPAVAIYSPNGGETYGSGETREIGWNLGSGIWNPTDNVVIEFSADGGATYETPAIYDGEYDIISSNSISLTVPDIITTQGLIKITNTTNGDTDTSDGTFEIQPISLEVPTDLFVLENGNGFMTMSWTDNETNETGYRIEVSPDNASWSINTNNLPADSEIATTTALINQETAFWWRVVVFNDFASSPSASRFAGRITPPGNALVFDGVDDYVQLEDPTAFDFGTGDFTAEAWFKTNNVTANQSLINDFPGNVTSYFALYIDAGQLKAALSNSVSDLNTATFVEANKWYHAALVRSGDNVMLYVDGVEEASVSGMDTRNVASTGPVNLGRQVGGGSQLNGELDEVRIWNVARTPTEISSNLFNTLNGNETGLVAYYRFDQTSGTVLPDRAINDLTGTVVTGGDPQWVTSEALTETIITLELQTPNGGESLMVGEEYEVNWVTENIESTDLIEIRLSIDGGANYSIVADGTFATYPSNTFNWTVPASPTTQARIQIANTSIGVEDNSDFNFTIVQPVVPTISITNPEGGEFWEVGSQQTISWTDEGFDGTDNIEIRISRDAGVNYEIISQGILDSTYPSKQISWAVEGPISTAVFVQIANTTKGVVATSSEALEIGTITRTITVTSPNGGETWMLENPATITWDSEGMESTDNIRIEISTDNGDTFPFMPVNSTFSQFPDNTFTWSSVATALGVSDNAIVRITNNTKGISDVSDAVFSVVPAADVIAPSFSAAPSVSIGNQDYEISVILDEISTVYYVALEDESQMPTAAQVKDAVVNSELVTGQIASGSFSYEEVQTPITESGTADFVLNNQYDFYFTAEDAEGNLNAGYGVPNVLAVRVFTPLENDSIALRRIYDEMNGVDWLEIANDWTDEANAITDWSEVIVSEGRVTAIDLSEKGISGTMPELQEGELDQLVTFDLSDNEITHVADFSGISTLSSLDVRNNRLSFTPIITNLDVTGFEYDPQRGFGEINYDTIDAGSNKSLSAPFLGSGVNYEWRFGPLIPGQRFNNEVEEIAGGLGKSQFYTIQNISAENQGTYRFIATHEDSRLVEDFAIEGRNQNILGRTDLFGTIRSNDSPISGGEVFVYRQTPEGPFAKEDSTDVGSDGSYALLGVVLGNFIVQVKPDRDTDPTAIQTYYISAETYDEADTLFLDSRKDNIDIDLLFYEPSPIDPEGATVAGVLESDFDDPPEEEGSRVTARRKVKKAGCAMRRFKAQGRPDQDDVETEIAYYLETDDEGFFNFEGVESGRYLLSIEFPGVPMDQTSDVEFFIDPDKENQVFDVNALITELGIVVTTEEVLFTWKPYIKEVNMYPNPTDGILGMDYTVYRDIENLQIQIIDVTGRTLIDQQVMHLLGRHHTTVDMTDLSSGVYFMILTDQEGTFYERFKVSRK